MKKAYGLFISAFVALITLPAAFGQETKVETIQQEEQKPPVKGEIILNEDGKTFTRDGEIFTFGEDYSTLEKAVWDSRRARLEIESARGNSRTAGVLGAIAGGMSGTGLGIYLGESSDETRDACWIFQGVCCGFVGLAIIPIQAEKRHIINAVKYYNEDLQAGKLIKE